jgi:hypothetical protein
MIFDRSDSPAPQPGEKNQNTSAAFGRKNQDALVYLVLRRFGRWHVKSRGRFSAPYSSEAKAIQGASVRAERSFKNGRPAVIAVYTQQSGIKTIRKFEQKSDPAV